jgi:hypothetical protein
MRMRPRQLKRDAPERERSTPPRLETASTRRGDLPRHAGAGSWRLPAALGRAGNAVTRAWLSRKAGGRPLDPDTRASMEAAFDADFQRVRLHDDPQAAAATQAAGAVALTHEGEIALAPQAPELSSPTGQKLLAHELAHVVQQERAGEIRSTALDQPGDRYEVDAGRAAAAVEAGQPAQVAATGAPPAVQRQTSSPVDDAATRTAAEKVIAAENPVENAVQAVLNREWEAQSHRERPFRITASVVEGLGFVFASTPAGIGTIGSQLQHDPGTPEQFLARIRGKLPKSIPAWALAALNRHPTSTRSAPKKSEEPPPAVNQPAMAADPLHTRGESGPVPQPSQSESDAIGAALKEAARRFLDTPTGKELAESVKRFVFSKEGVALDVIVVGEAVSFLAANDLKLPSLPEIELGDGIKLKIDYTGRIRDLPPLVRQMFGEQRPVAPDTQETKIGLTLTVTDRQAANFARAVGQFFSVVAKAIARGVVKAGTVIGKAARTIWPELAAAAGGAGLGALIGGLALGPLGAGIGALIGAGVGVIGALLHRLLQRKKRTKPK